MYSRQELYRSLGIEQTVYDFGEQIQRELKPRFEAIDDVAEYNQLKVIRAMQENRVSGSMLCFQQRIPDIMISDVTHWKM